MPRSARAAPGGVIFHCLNRGNDRQALFDDDQDFAAFERVAESALATVPVRLLAYCLMPNHAPLSELVEGWHLLLWPRKDADLARFTDGDGAASGGLSAARHRNGACWRNGRCCGLPTGSLG